MAKNKDIRNPTISPDEQALQALKVIAGKMGEVAGSLKRLYSVTYKLTLSLNGIIDSYTDDPK